MHADHRVKPAYQASFSGCFDKIGLRVIRCLPERLAIATCHGDSKLYRPSLLYTISVKDTKNNYVSGRKERRAVTKKQPEGIDLYARFALAGALGCSITHGGFTPVDVVKTKIQLDPATYNRGTIATFRQVIANEGAGALLTGAGATFSGYFVQGAFKFGGYEFFKKQSIDYLGLEKARANRGLVYAFSAASAEFFASVALCPLEATRIRLVSTPGFANGLIGGFSKIAKTEGLGGFYSGFGPILFKQ
ncbi:hypothetical protein D6D01_03672 [Aureobasidium pullulans]|uniref:Mitochondrial phosphate carrier protein n=1 Tax=Aureobasidium pullulans TaxID=5580 RepID=A0A4S9LHV8_AURPU|nr:hypothetical protein D6D01_03672 [Aureobasidium pullulans]